LACAWHGFCLYVVDVWKKVMVYNILNPLETPDRCFGKAHLLSPIDIAVMSKPYFRLIVLDDKQIAVFLFDINDQLVLKFGKGSKKFPGLLSSPFKLLVDDKKGEIFVADWCRRSIRAFSAQNGKFIRTFQYRSFLPWNITIYDMGLLNENFYLCSPSKVYVCTIHGQLIKGIEFPPSNSIQRIVMSSHGRIITVGKGQIQLWDEDSCRFRFVRTVANDIQDKTKYALWKHFKGGLAYNPDTGVLAVCNYYQHKVDIFH